MENEISADFLSKHGQKWIPPSGNTPKKTMNKELDDFLNLI